MLRLLSQTARIDLEAVQALSHIHLYIFIFDLKRLVKGTWSDLFSCSELRVYR